MKNILKKYPAVILLVVASLLAMLPGSPADAVNPTTGESIDGVSVEFDSMCAVYEPFIALGQMIAGSKDIRATAVSFLIWAFLIVGLVVSLKFKKQNKKTSLVIGGGVGAGLLAVLMLTVYLGAFLFLRLPDRKLVTNLPDTLIADLQTHTYASHDGIVDVRSNVDWHINSGCDIVAFTEHNSIAGALAAQKLNTLNFTALAGVEYKLSNGGFLLAIMSQQINNVGQLVPPPSETSKLPKWIKNIHANGGAVIALYWKLSAKDIHNLAALGVDGFEIANAGHPDLSNDVRAAILEESKKRGVALVASSDWHGWGSVARTWTLLKLKGLDKLPVNKLPEHVVLMLRSRGHAGVIPVVSGEMRSLNILEKIFAPLIALIRYFRELDFLRVLGLWVWFGIFVLLAKLLQKFNLNAPLLLGLGYFGIVSFATTLGGTWVLGQCASGGGNAYAHSLGLQVGITGLIATVATVVVIWRSVKKSIGSKKPQV